MRIHAYQNSIFRPWKIAPLLAMLGKLYGVAGQNQSQKKNQQRSVIPAQAGIQRLWRLKL